MNSFVCDKSLAQLVGREKTFLIEERISLKSLPSKINDLQIWMPLPTNDAWQAIDDFKLTSPFTTRFITEKEYGNRIVCLTPKNGVTDIGSYEIVMSYKVRRREAGASDYMPAYNKDLSQFLKPDGTVPIGGEIRELAEKITQGKVGDLEKVKATYDYLINNLTYAKDGPNVCGIGNSLITLKYKKGMCTDWHSLFISLVRSLGIPAKFEIGFRIPEGMEEGKIEGYHCWAKFYIKGKGWIPLDVSEAYKHPEKRDYFFGHIDENRVVITTGRDIRLDNSLRAQTLNFFIYPYMEVNGIQSKVEGINISFKKVE